MPQISSNFILRSKSPNFERDCFATLNEMRSVNSAWMDEGHISYCKQDGKHYIFNSNDGTLSGADRWTELKLEITDLTQYIDSNVVYKVEDISDLTHTLAGSLSLGRIVYVKSNHSLYYNTYDNTIPAGEHQTSECLEDSTNWFYPLSVDLSDYVTKVDFEDEDSEVLLKLDDRYVKKSNSEDSEEGTDLGEVMDNVALNTNAIKGINTRVDALESSTVSKEELASKEYATIGHVAESCAGVQNNVTTLDGRVSQVENDINGYKNESGEYQSGIKDIIEKHNLDLYGDGEDVKGVIQDLVALKDYADSTFAKPEDINDQLTTYYPTINPESDEPKDKGAVWVGSDEYGELSGKTKTVIGGKYTFNDVFDEILFNRITPTASDPSISVKLITSMPEEGTAPWFIANNIEWYNESDRSILVEAYSVTPNSEDFVEDNIEDSYISYPESYKKIHGEEKDGKYIVRYTDGLRPSATGAPRTIGNCKVFKNGEWEDYSENYGLPTAETLAPGEYHYHIIGYFNGKNIIIDNYNQKIQDVWNSNTAVESSDYITLYASKPVYYNTVDGMVKNPLKLWSDDIMSDEFTLVPSCQLEQSFMVPRKLKAMYIWNDLLGGYGQVPMVADLSDEGIATNNVIPAYFKESVGENGYYTYKYDVATNGHRGAVKIKVEF